MSNLANIARPYAQAAFEAGKADNSLANWQESLQVLAAIVEDSQIQQILTNPHISGSEIEGVIVEVAEKVAGAQVLTEKVRNFLSLVVENQRVLALPTMHKLFVDKRAEQEQTLNVTVTSAVEPDGAQKQQYIDILSKRFGRNVNIQFSVDGDMLGGAVIRAGDMVIDGSVRGQLAQLVDAVRL